QRGTEGDAGVVTLRQGARFHQRTSVVAVDEEDFVEEPVIFDGKAKRLGSVSRISDGPEIVPRRWRPGHGPVRLRILDRAPVPNRPQFFHREPPGPAGPDGQLGAGAIEIPVVVDAQADSLQTKSVGIALARDFAEQFAEPVFVLWLRRMFFID